MKESILKYKDIIVTVASTGSTNEAYSAKLNRLVSAYQSLTAQQRRSSFLRQGNTIFSINNSSTGSARYVYHSITDSHCYILQYSLAENASSAFSVDITPSGNSIINNSLNLLIDNIDLCYYA